VRCESCGKSRVRIGIDLAARLFCPEHGVAERLRCLVGELSRAERLQSRLAFIERALCRFSRAVELLSQLVE
jgi:hypothetical protein